MTWQGALDDGALLLSCRCPRAGLTIERRLRLRDDTLRVETHIRHGETEAKAIDFCEHLSIGDPFLDGVVVSAGVDRAWETWPDEAEAGVAVAEALAVPPAAQRGGLCGTGPFTCRIG